MLAYQPEIECTRIEYTHRLDIMTLKALIVDTAGVQCYSRQVKHTWPA